MSHLKFQLNSTKRDVGWTGNGKRMRNFTHEHCEFLSLSRLSYLERAWNETFLWIQITPVSYVGESCSNPQSFFLLVKVSTSTRSKRVNCDKIRSRDVILALPWWIFFIHLLCRFAIFHICWAPVSYTIEKLMENLRLITEIDGIKIHHFWYLEQKLHWYIRSREICDFSLHTKIGNLLWKIYRQNIKITHEKSGKEIDREKNWVHTAHESLSPLPYHVWRDDPHTAKKIRISKYILCISHVTRAGYKSSSTQSSRLKIDAVPRLIQWFGFLSVLNWMNITKFDEWPVVASTPRLSVVL